MIELIGLICLTLVVGVLAGIGLAAETGPRVR
jgi:hypothetical protein